MNVNAFWSEVTISLIFAVLLLFVLNPFGIWMPDALVMALAAALAATFAVFALFIWREHPRDEREELHRMVAGRAAFLGGAGTLVIGIIIQSFGHNIDPWLVGALGAMVLVKIGTRAYSRIRN